MYNTMIFNPPHIPDQSTLRDYQKECIEKIENAKEGSYLIVLPTGSGKTYIFSHIPRHGRMLILSHRDELVHQPAKYFDCPYGVEKASEKSNGEEVVSASVQSLHRRLDRFSPDDFDVIITDEAHHSTAKTYQKIYDYFNPRLHLGFTATPDRNDKEDLNKIYSDILYFKDIKWGIKENYLTDIKCLRVDIGYDLRNVHQQMGDFKIGELSGAMSTESCVNAVAKAYEDYHKGQTLIFGVNVRHCELLKKAIKGSKVITAKTKNREKILKDFTNRKFECLINCMVCSEGTDLPLVETVIVARPTRNQSLYTQIVGRGLRPYPNKDFLTLIDCVGVTKLPICTAPNLFGLNVDNLPKKQRDKAQGMLTDMGRTIGLLYDTPDVWIKGVELIKLFKEEMSVDTKRLNISILPNDAIKIPLGDTKFIYIEAPDALNYTNACILKNRKRQESITKRETLQKVIDDVYLYLVNNCKESRPLWDLNIVEKTWGKNPASVKQITFLLRLFQETGFNPNDIDMTTLTKGQAMYLIEKLKEKPVKKKCHNYNKLQTLATEIVGKRDEKNKFRNQQRYARW